MQADFRKFTLEFIHPMGTSRGTLFTRDVFILALTASDKTGFGECAPLPGLSIDGCVDFNDKLTETCQLINAGHQPNELALQEWPAIRFGLESALLGLNSPDQVLFDTDFTRHGQSLPINGLVVMGDVDQMLAQARTKIKDGFNCIKIKIGALDFAAECDVLGEIRKRYPPAEIELRLDANGAFSANNALNKLRRLAEFDIHSLEQPIKAGAWQEMAAICQQSPIPIALDEELIGVESADKQKLLQVIQPDHIILKPTLLGGFQSSEEWIRLAADQGIGYWITSALESNIGLNAISQWTATLGLTISQGLGTGKLFTSNFPSSLHIKKGALTYEASSALSNIGLNHLELVP